MTSEFDAIDYARELEAAGVQHVQAIIHGKAMTEVVKTAIRQDLQALEQQTPVLTQVVKEGEKNYRITILLMSILLGLTLANAVLVFRL